MIGEAIHDDTLKALVSQHVIRDVVVGRVAGDGRSLPVVKCCYRPTAAFTAAAKHDPRFNGGAPEPSVTTDC